MGVHFIVFGLQPNAPDLAKKPLHGRVLVSDQRNHDLAVAGIVLLANTTKSREGCRR